MKLGSLKSKASLDGELAIVAKDQKSFVKVTELAPSLREAVEKWDQVSSSLEKVYSELNQGKVKNAQTMDERLFHSCLPRTFLFADGSAFIHHIKLVRKARNAELPETLMTVPLMYQGDSGQFLAPTEDIPQVDFAHGTDFEAEVGVITSFVPMGVTPKEAIGKIRLFCLINDVSLRGLIPAELGQGFGFFQSKPASALSPFAITGDELMGQWKDGRIHLSLDIKLNNEFFGKPHAGAMHFNFGDLIAHAAKTRNLPAGTIVGSGTVSNEDETLGSGCLSEKRTLEQIKTGKPVTPFMKDGDQVEISMQDGLGNDLFGRIKQRVKAI